MCSIGFTKALKPCGRLVFSYIAAVTSEIPGAVRNI